MKKIFVGPLGKTKMYGVFGEFPRKGDAIVRANIAKKAGLFDEVVIFKNPKITDEGTIRKSK